MHLIILRYLLACLLYTAASCSLAETYRYTDASGNTTYTDVTPPESFGSTTVDLEYNVIEGPVYNESGQKRVVLYSAAWCRICKQARAYLDGRGIEYEEYDIDHDEKGRRDFAEMHGTGVPIILVGEQRMRGFNPTWFQDLFRRVE